MTRLTKANTKTLVIHQLIAPYFTDLQALNRSPKTIERYRDTLASFITFLENRKLPTDLLFINQDHIYHYIEHLKQSERWQSKPGLKQHGKLSPYTVQGQVRDLKAFWGWMDRRGYLRPNPLVGMPLPKVPVPIIKILTKDHLEKLLTAIDRTSPIGQKYYCLFVLLLDSGMRITEAISIRLNDLDLGPRFIKITGKGMKERIITFSKLTGKTLSNYLTNARSHLTSTKNPYLFPAGDGHITANSVQQYLRRLAEKAGIKEIRVHPHLFRHTAATALITGGANVFMVRDLLGHSSLATTLKYTHLQPEDVRREHAKYSPAEKLLKHTIGYKGGYRDN